MEPWLIVQFTRAAGGEGKVIARGLTKSDAKDFVDILDKQQEAVGTIHFTYSEVAYDNGDEG